MPSYIFLDIDGTLINARQELPDDARRALVAARKNGHTVVIATGRAITQIYPWLLNVGFDGVIGDNGGYIEFGGEVLRDLRVSEEGVRELTEWVESYHGQWCWQASDGIYGSPHFLDWFASAELNGTSGNWDAFVKLVDPQLKLEAPKNSAKLTFIVQRGEGLSLEECREYWQGKFTVVEGSISDGVSLSVEVSLPGVNKGEGVQYLCEHLGVDLADTIALGDSANDIEMLSIAGVGVAMGNATPVAREAADWSTTSVDDGGVACAFARLGVVESSQE